MSGRDQLEFQQMYLKRKTLFLLECQLLLLELIKPPYKALSLPNEFFPLSSAIIQQRKYVTLPKMTELYWAWRKSQVTGASPGAADGQAHPPLHFELYWNHYGFSAEGIRITETVNLQWSCACPISALTGMVIAGHCQIRIQFVLLTEYTNQDHSIDPAELLTMRFYKHWKGSRKETYRLPLWPHRAQVFCFSCANRWQQIISTQQQW